MENVIVFEKDNGEIIAINLRYFVTLDINSQWALIHMIHASGAQYEVYGKIRLSAEEGRRFGNVLSRHTNAISSKSDKTEFSSEAD